MSAELWVVVGVGAALAGLIVNGQLAANRRMDRLEEGMSRLRDDVGGLRERLARVEAALEDLRARMARAEAALDDLRARMTRVEGWLDPLSETNDGRRADTAD